MSQSNQPPFKRGEWVRGNGYFDGIAPLCRVKDCEPWEAGWLIHTAPYGCYEDIEMRRASARELRAESKRLAKRAAELSAAADAVEEKKKRK